MDPKNIDDLIAQDIRIIFLLEYIPPSPLNTLLLTPCPVSNIATHNLTNSSLREGLASPLFKEICKNEHLLETEGMPCALFAHPDEVSNLAQLGGAYKTNLNLEE